MFSLHRRAHIQTSQLSHFGLARHMILAMVPQVPAYFMISLDLAETWLLHGLKYYCKVIVCMTWSTNEVFKASCHWNPALRKLCFILCQHMIASFKKSIESGKPKGFSSKNLYIVVCVIF